MADTRRLHWIAHHQEHTWLPCEATEDFIACGIQNLGLLSHAAGAKGPRTETFVSGDLSLSSVLTRRS